MGKFDAADVIKAAATSNLGVISLIVLALAFLAWRFFQQSSDKVKLVAFATMFLGAAGFVAAVMVAGGDASTPAPSPSDTATPSAASTGPAAQAASASPSGVPDIDGAWHDADGYSFNVRQDGVAFTYQTVFKGEVVGRGAGTIAGNRLSYRYTQTDGGEGACEAQLSTDARMISGKCADGTSQWEFSIER